MSAESLREQITEAIDKHGYWRNPEVGGECPECGHLYYERRPGAYMDPDLDWLRGEIDKHQADAVLAVLGEVTVTEEWAVKHRDGWVAGPGSSLDAMRALVADPLMPGAVAVVRRAVVTTRRVGEWEVAE